MCTFILLDRSNFRSFVAFISSIIVLVVSFCYQSRIFDTIKWAAHRNRKQAAHKDRRYKSEIDILIELHCIVASKYNWHKYMRYHRLCHWFICWWALLSRTCCDTKIYCKIWEKIDLGISSSVCCYVWYFAVMPPILGRFTFLKVDFTSISICYVQTEKKTVSLFRPINRIRYRYHFAHRVVNPLSFFPFFEILSFVILYGNVNSQWNEIKISTVLEFSVNDYGCNKNVGHNFNHKIVHQNDPRKTNWF